MSAMETTVADDPVTSPPQPGAGDEHSGGVRSEVDALIASQRRLNLELAAASQLGQQFGRTLSAAFVGLAVQGRSFGDVLGSLALSLSRLTLSTAFKPLEAVLGSAFQSLIGAPSPFSGGSIAAPAAFPISGIAGSAGSASAAVLPRSESVVGAAKPERAMPAIVLNVTTPDAESFRRSETQIAAVLARAVSLGQRNL